VTNGNDILVPKADAAEDGTPIYDRDPYGFSLVIEARPGGTGTRLGSSTYNWSPANPTGLPDLQIEVSNDLGNGSPTVCDESGSTAGGVPAVTPFDFSPADAAAINDLSCRFKDGSGAPAGILISAEACTLFLPAEIYHFVDASSKIQFCGVVTNALSFPSGETVVAVRVRDVDSNLSAISKIIIRVP
jgi:hypothetical protein